MSTILGSSRVYWYLEEGKMRKFSIRDFFPFMQEMIPTIHVFI